MAVSDRTARPQCQGDREVTRTWTSRSGAQFSVLSVSTEVPGEREGQTSGALLGSSGAGLGVGGQAFSEPGVPAPSPAC